MQAPLRNHVAGKLVLGEMIVGIIPNPLILDLLILYAYEPEILHPTLQVVALLVDILNRSCISQCNIFPYFE